MAQMKTCIQWSNVSLRSNGMCDLLAMRFGGKDQGKNAVYSVRDGG